MSDIRDEKKLRRYTFLIYTAMESGLSFNSAKEKYPFPELSDEERLYVYREARRHIMEAKEFFRQDANKWFWYGGGILAIISLILFATGEPVAGRHVGQMRLGILLGVGLIIFGIFKKIKPL